MLERLRLDARTQSIPVIFLTARSDRTDVRHGMNLGADDYLTKPFSRDELLQSIAATFKRRQTDESKALKQALSTLEEVGRIAQHDLRTPLGSLAAAPALFRAGRVMSHSEESLLRMMEIAANRAMRMVDLSRDMYRMESGSYVFAPMAVNLTLLARGVLDDLAAQARSKGVEIILTAPPIPVYAQAEDALCYSIIANLAKNAVEAAPEGSTVSLDLHPGDRVQLVIHNLGAVPEALRPIFFEKYATAGKVGGTGLGTYSSRLLAQAQGGTVHMLTFESEGTTLTLELEGAAAPLVEPSGDAATADPAQRLLRVLLADDDAFNLMVLSDQFEGEGVMLSTAINGRLALEIAHVEHQDLIVMDVEMPIMDGVTAMQKIRAFQASTGQRASCIVAFTGHTDAQSQSQYLLEGFDHCLEKPSSVDKVSALLKVVRKAV